MTLNGLTGTKYLLDDKPFSSGGEGDIYRIKGVRDKVIKLYHSGRITKELEQKIAYMAKRPPSARVLNRVAWPVDLVYDASGRFCGFAMPKLDITNELNLIYAYPPRTGITYEQKLLIAQNICHVINEVHEAGYIFGDFNPGNIGINLKTGYAYFLDTDSYHIIDRTNNQTFRCVVCLDGYVAPELIAKCDIYKRSHPQDKDELYKKIPLDTFTVDTDNFALAIHMFKLMMNGFTPFNGINEMESASTASPGVGTIAVKRDNYCFKPGKKPQSPAVPPITVLPNELAGLFGRAFVEGRKNPSSRPSAKEWYNAIERYKGELITCKRNQTHMYRGKLSECPWCIADQKYADVLRPGLGEKPFSSPARPTPPTVQAPQPINPARPQVAPATNPVPPAAFPGAYPQARQVQPRSAIPPSKRIGSIFMTLAWVVFAADILFSLWPFIRTGSFVFNEYVLLSLDAKLHMVFALCSVALLSFLSHLKEGMGWTLESVACSIWSALVCLTGVTVLLYSKMPGSSFSEDMFFGGLAKAGAVFLAANLLPSIVGGMIHEWPNRKKMTPPQKKRLSKEKLRCILFFGVPSMVCVPLFLNLNFFYSVVTQYNLITIAIIAYAAFIVVIDGGGEQWADAFLIVSVQYLVLSLGVCGGSAIILWFVLAIAALFAAGRALENSNSPRTLALLAIAFFAGTYVALTVLNDGAEAVSSISHWIAAAPALIGIIMAAWDTAKEAFGL